jgi:predicted GIY-YIG superfamily endonuclease
MKKHRNYWTKENCISEGLKYSNRIEFQKNSKGAYMSCLKNDWLEEVCSHMIIYKKPKNYWTKERCKEEALKYSDIKSFREESSVAYNKSVLGGFLDEICVHMSKIEKHKKGYWTLEMCKLEAEKYKNRTDFKKSKAYAIVVKNKWFDEIKHLPSTKKPRNYWTKERCREEALKYDKRIDFETNSISACITARKKGWIDEICQHMIVIGNKYKRCIYAIEFSDNYVYVGLTYNLQERFNNHLKKRSSVFNHIKKTGLMPKLSQLTEYLTIEDAKRQEEIKVIEYRSNGWKILNKKKCGGLGFVKLFWNKERCYEESLKYRNRGDFKKGSNSAYNSALRHGWIDDFF